MQRHVWAPGECLQKPNLCLLSSPVSTKQNTWTAGLYLQNRRIEKDEYTQFVQLPIYLQSCQHFKIPISNETDRDKLSFGFWSHLTRFNTKYKANAKTFLTSDCMFTQWRMPWWNRRLFAGSYLLPITTSHTLVPWQTRYRSIILLVKFRTYLL